MWFDFQHPHINPLYGIFVDMRGFHMVSPWRSRGSVKDWMNAGHEVRTLVVVSSILALHNHPY